MQYIQLQGQVAADLDTPLEGGFNLFIDTNDGSIKSKDSSGNISSVAGGLVDTTYNQLTASLDSGSLNPGTYYKITDFRTCYDQPNYNYDGSTITTGNYKTGSLSPIIVFALDTGSLASDAYQPQYPTDNIKYDITFNQTEVTSNPAFGRIIYRKDERGNAMDYDFREVLFKRYDSYVSDDMYNGTISLSMTGSAGFISGSGTTFTNFGAEDIVGVWDKYNSPLITYYQVLEVLSDYGMIVTGSVINTVDNKRLVNAGTRSGMSWKKSNIISNTNQYEYLTFTDITQCFNNVSTNPAEFTIWDEYTFLLPNNVFRGGSYRDNSFVCDFRNNTFSDDFDSNLITDSFYNNIIDDDFDNNTIHAPFYNNVIDVNFQENLIMDSFYNNNLGDDDGTNVNNNTFKGSFNNNFYEGYNPMSNNTFNKSFSNNIINEGFNDNTFYSANDNEFRREVTGNTIGNSFYDNVFTQDFSHNTIGYNCYNNDVYSQFTKNTIAQNFYNNTIGVLNDESYFEYNNIGYEFKGNQILGDFNKNRIADFFNGNQIAYTFIKNTIGDYFYINDIEDNFEENVIGNDFESNTISDNFQYNKIGNGFYNNDIGPSFGRGSSSERRGNVIGNDFGNNTIGTYFWDNNIGNAFGNNTIGREFQYNRIEAPIDEVDFTTYLGRINGVTYPPTAGTNGTYTNVTGTTSGIGVNATFTIDVTGSFVETVTITNIGKLYELNDTITIASGSFGGETDLVLTVSGLNATPMVYETYNKTIQRRFDGTPMLSSLNDSGQWYVSQYINEPID
jgi:hypothetical protein